MTRRRGEDTPEWEEEGLDPEGPSPEDLERFGDEMVDCPNCGMQVYDQTEICPRCGMAIERRRSGVPLPVVLTALAVVIVFAAVFVF